MSITPQNLVRHELIGLKIRVENSSDSTQRDIVGTVIDETYNTLKIESKNKEINLIKENCVFVFTLPDKTKVQVDGKIIVSRPEDRIKKKLSKW